eukprot:gene8863-11956_t
MINAGQFISISGPLKSCSLSLKGKNTVEDSHLTDNSNTCDINAQTIWGLLRGLETFSELLVRDGDAVTLKYSSVQISDYPRFAHRGILIDSSRHYLPVASVQRIIDTLPITKYNVLHWHIVDAESFPVNTPSVPTMVKGAYTPTMIYSMNELAALTGYARDRGVDIVFEMDMPGHAGSWGKGAPETLADCSTEYTFIDDLAMNPTKDETYSTIQSILSDVIRTTKSAKIHLGGDEVVYGCWAADKSITSFMAENGIKSYDQLLAYFISKSDKIANDLGASVIHWEEVFLAGCEVPENTLFQVWTDSSKVSQVTGAGYKIIASPSDYWYLDHADNTWQVMYNYDPYMGITNTTQQALIYGGEVCLWGEHVDDKNIESFMYPRASAAGERMWSLQTVTNIDDALNRLLIQRCRLVARGVYSSPVKPGYCDVAYI